MKEITPICEESGRRIRYYCHFWEGVIGFDIQCYVDVDWSMFIYGIDSDIDGNLKTHRFPPRVRYG